MSAFFSAYLTKHFLRTFIFLVLVSFAFRPQLPRINFAFTTFKHTRYET